MNSIYRSTGIAFFVTLAISCGSASVKDKEAGTDKKAQLQQLRDQQTQLNQQIRAIEEELARSDSSGALNAKLVAVTPVKTENFVHFIELQGRIDAENIAYVTPRGMGGQVTAVLVKQGDYVNKGQLLLKLDNAIALQQIDQVQTQLDLAKTLYDRRKNLWEKNIGTEIELLQAKNNVDNLTKQIGLLREQAAMSEVYAQISGVADMVNIKVGEYFSPQTATVLGIRIVNTNNLKVTAQVPENYLHRVNEGARIQISLPDINKTIETKITVKGKTIDLNSRSFYVEARLPASKDFRPNQIALVKIQDYQANNTVTVPMNTLQNDEKGKYVMVAVEENGRLLARKRAVEIGELYGDNLEIKSGLQPNEALITEGFQGLYDGQTIVTNVN
ncbi:MAG TPA: efflux RND transporter periplasmic adaptor subunit [Flavitalea sp.]|nr:efflux RND transporter periplasmic adaptor subunit [Flavitalea sp.]